MPFAFGRVHRKRRDPERIDPEIMRCDVPCRDLVPVHASEGRWLAKSLSSSAKQAITSADFVSAIICRQTRKAVLNPFQVASDPLGTSAEPP
jgi:hypothetical protein